MVCGAVRVLFRALLIIASMCCPLLTGGLVCYNVWLMWGKWAVAQWACCASGPLVKFAPYDIHTLVGIPVLGWPKWPMVA